jgi:hypothetical protein
MQVPRSPENTVLLSTLPIGSYRERLQLIRPGVVEAVLWEEMASELTPTWSWSQQGWPLNYVSLCLSLNQPNPFKIILYN